mgnify:CR=1 FL=1
MTLGLRGIVYLEVEVHGPKQDVHSGLFGGIVQNPNSLLVDALAGLVGGNGHINVPGLYDGLAPLSAREKALYAQLEVDEHTIEVVANLSAKAVNTTSAAEVAGYGSRVTDLTLTYPASTGTGSSSSAATPMSAGGLGSAPAPAAPAPAVPVSGGEGGVQSVGYDVGDSGETNTTELAANNSQNGVNAGSGTRNTPHIEPASAVTNDAGTPASGASQGASGGSVLGKMMSTLSSLGSGGSAAGGGSPLSSMSSMGSGLGNFGNAGGASPAGAQPASMLNPGAAAMPGAGLGTCLLYTSPSPRD